MEFSLKFHIAENGHIEVLKLLLHVGGDDTPRNNGTTPLFMAAQNGHAEGKILVGKSSQLFWREISFRMIPISFFHFSKKIL